MTWVLCLNRMTNGNIEILEPVARADSKNQLVEYLAIERVEPYITDNRWRKTYRQGGPLEWHNPPFELDEHLHFRDVGSADEWAAAAREKFEKIIMSLPEAR